MNPITISDQHLAAVQREATRRTDRASTARILAEWFDELMIAKKKDPGCLICGADLDKSAHKKGCDLA